MHFGKLGARFALMAALCLTMFASPAHAQFWQCAPYARAVSGIEIFGNAHSWWDQAAGRYARGDAPAVGSVMSFAPTAKMRLGHVAMVSKVIDERKVLLNHANWSRRGGVEKDVVAIDVSAAGDWSKVKVWFASNNGLGTSVYPVNGFIYADAAPKKAPSVLDGVSVAQLDLSRMGITTALSK